MTKNQIWQAIDLQYRKYKKQMPSWPVHPAAQAGRVCEESGKLMKSCMERKYTRVEDSLDTQTEAIRSAAIRTAAAAIRFLENLEK